MAEVTQKTIESVTAYREKYPKLTYEEIAKLCGTSHTTVGKILRGEYSDRDERNSDQSGTNSALSQLSEQVNTTRNVLVEMADSTTLGELYAVIASVNNLLVQVVLMMANADDPNHAKSKATAAHFRDMAQKYTIKD